MTHSNATAIMEYSFLVVFANDDLLDQAELAMIERLALEDGVVDERERQVLRNIFARARAHGVSEAVEAEISHFCTRYGV